MGNYPIRFKIIIDSVLTSCRETGEIKIVDFGTGWSSLVILGKKTKKIFKISYPAQQLVPGVELKTMCGTPEFVAPEVFFFWLFGLFLLLWLFLRKQLALLPPSFSYLKF